MGWVATVSSDLKRKNKNIDREGNFNMIELIKFANSFKYIHTIIKTKIEENEWDNCLLTYDTIKAFHLNSNYCTASKN